MPAASAIPTSTPLVQRLTADLEQNSALAETSTAALEEITDVAAFLDQIAADQSVPVETLLPAYSWWFGACAAKESSTYQGIEPYVPWIWIFDALVMLAPTVVNDNVVEAIDDQTAIVGGPRFLLTTTGDVSQESSFLAKVLLGADETVGATFPGWTIRRIARWYAALILAEDYTMVSDITPETAQDLAGRIMRRAVQVDPLGVERSEEAKIAFLGFVEATAEALGDSTSEDLAGGQKDALLAGDPLSNRAVAKAAAKAPVKAAALVARKAHAAVTVASRTLPNVPRMAGNTLLVAGGLAAVGFGIYIAATSVRRR